MLNPRAHVRFRLRLLAAALVLWPILAGATDTKSLPAASATDLMRKDLVSGPDKEVVMLAVTYRGGGASLPHRHDAQVFVYVLEGEVTMQVRGSAAATLRAGQTFFEGPNDVHVISANASKTSPAKILVIMIKDKGKPESRTVAE
jgi:quercetin dioxygenase-like cupin family protein